VEKTQKNQLPQQSRCHLIPISSIANTQIRARLPRTDLALTAIHFCSTAKKFPTQSGIELTFAQLDGISPGHVLHLNRFERAGKRCVRLTLLSARCLS